VQGRFGERLSHATVIRAGAWLLAAGAAAELVVAAFGLHPALAAAGWVLAGGGMGLMYPRVSTLVLAESAEDERGFNSAAKSISDAVGASVALALTGLLFAALAATSAGASFAGTFAVTTLLGGVGILVSARVRA
jgi:MFS family permease